VAPLLETKLGRMAMTYRCPRGGERS
jgi:hypothetical protein